MRDDFAIFILSNGRADNFKTIDALKKTNYDGKIYIVIDNEDSQIKLYKKNFGEDNVIVFDKKESAKDFDVMDNFEGRKVPTYARNQLWRLAKEKGLTYFLELEDDYQYFLYKIETKDKLRTIYIGDMNKVIDSMIEFLDESGAYTVAFAQGGDLIGGANSFFRTGLARKAMNTFFCRTDKPFTFPGRFNDDVNAYVSEGKTGTLFLTVTNLVTIQTPTQTNTGGITETYKKYGTYVKSFYSVIIDPSAVKISAMGVSDIRIHHEVNWNNAVPKILGSRWKK